MTNPDIQNIKVVSRRSPLALIQVKELFELFPSLSYEVREMDSFGDRHKEISLMSGIAEDFFTRELDDDIRSGNADVAVHSAKDLPYPLPAGQELYCLTEAADKTDSLVSRDNLPLEKLPAGSRIGTSSKMRREELLRLRQDIEVVSIRGTIEERVAQVDNGTIDALIVATCALQRLGMSDRIAQRLPFATHPLQGHLAVTGRTGREDLKALFSERDIRRRFGRVTLVGFGPGDPSLLTLAADRALQEADIIFHDDLIDRDYLSRYDGEKVYVGKRNGKHSHAQDEINELIYQAAYQGKRVVRLKGGDPMVFAHGREEIDYLRRRFIQVDVIPGISTGLAMAALTQIPLTHRGVASSVAFVSGHGKEIETPEADTLLYYMGGSNLDVIAQALLDKGRSADIPAALVSDVSLPGQKTIYTTLGELRHAVYKSSAPVILVVGEVVALQRACALQHVWCTGTMASAPLPGEEVTHNPLIKLEEAEFTLPEDESFDYVVFTSRHGVRYFFETQSKDILTGSKIISVGPVTTEALRAEGVEPIFESPTESAEGILEYFRTGADKGSKVLLPRSDHKLRRLSDGLTEMGHILSLIHI